MGTKIDHIGIVVRDIKRSLLPYQGLLKLDVEEFEELDFEGAVYRLAFLSVGGVNLELVETSATSGLAAEFLREHGEGIHHIAFEVDDLERTFRELGRHVPQRHRPAGAQEAEKESDEGVPRAVGRKEVRSPFELHQA